MCNKNEEQDYVENMRRYERATKMAAVSSLMFAFGVAIGVYGAIRPSDCSPSSHEHAAIHPPIMNSLKLR